MLPDVRYLRQVKPKFLFGFHDAKPFGKSLHHAILDPVMHHLDEMTGAMRTDVSPTLICCRSQRLKDGAQLFHDLRFATDHQAVSFLQAPDSSTCTAIQEINAFRLEQRGMP